MVLVSGGHGINSSEIWISPWQLSKGNQLSCTPCFFDMDVSDLHVTLAKTYSWSSSRPWKPPQRSPGLRGGGGETGNRKRYLPV